MRQDAGNGLGEGSATDTRTTILSRPVGSPQYAGEGTVCLPEAGLSRVPSYGPEVGSAERPWLSVLRLKGGSALYSTGEVFALGAAAVGFAVVTAAFLRAVTMMSTGGGTALYAFFFERTVIQWINVGLFFFGALLVVHRIALGCCVRQSLQGSAWWEDRPASGRNLASDRIAKVRACKLQSGDHAAACYNQELHERANDELDQVYGLVGNVTQLILSLGFLGTVWGISMRFFDAFDTLSETSVAGLKTGLNQFTKALSTALDTTVLAILIALIVSAAVTIARWQEENALRALYDAVRGGLRIETAAHVAAPDPAGRNSR